MVKFSRVWTKNTKFWESFEIFQNISYGNCKNPLICHIFFKKTNKSAVLSGMIASPFGRVERAFHAARARMDLLAFPK